MSQMDNIMAKRQKEMEEAYEAVWDEGRYESMFTLCVCVCEENVEEEMIKLCVWKGRTDEVMCVCVCRFGPRDGQGLASPGL